MMLRLLPGLRSMGSVIRSGEAPETGTRWRRGRDSNQRYRLLDASCWLTDRLLCRPRVRIHLAPPPSLRFEGFSGEVRKLRACSWITLAGLDQMHLMPLVWTNL